MAAPNANSAPLTLEVAMTGLEKVLYTARTRTTGGRDGASRSSDGRLDIQLSSPGTAGGGTNPEQPAVQEDTRGILTTVSNGLAYQELFDVIAEPAFLDPTLMIIADTFLGIYPAARLSMPTSNCFITSALWASIGHAVGAGVGAWIPREKRPVVVCGDGGFQMVAHSLSTMAKYKHDTIVIIVDNGLYGYEQYLLSQTYYSNPGENPLPYAVLSSWDYEKLARAMGIGQVLTANSAASLRAALAAAKANMASPTVIHALVASRSLPAGL